MLTAVRDCQVRHIVHANNALKGCQLDAVVLMRLLKLFRHFGGVRQVERGQILNSAFSRLSSRRIIEKAIIVEFNRLEFVPRPRTRTTCGRGPPALCGRLDPQALV